MKEAAQLAYRLAALLNDPQPGLFTWNDAVARTYRKLMAAMEACRAT